VSPEKVKSELKNKNQSELRKPGTVVWNFSVKIKKRMIQFVESSISFDNTYGLIRNVNNYICENILWPKFGSKTKT
jgi:hypothetical protein